ncbi:DUF6886 family protein [Phenylobacterium sp.]|uniref:DUF6886 family protein n=1 Tax=Phenylobacterium sp. TaxID=1871053 RepID=UPI0030F44076
MRLFHFSDDPGIEGFVPRPVGVPSTRPPGRDWLNGPLVWAIDEATQPLYFFPRDCPRILLWPTPATTAEDRERWFGASDARMIAHIEWSWLERLNRGILYRYELPVGSFEDLEDAGMWVSRQPVTPLSVETLSNLPALMAAHGVELRVMAGLTSLREVWSTSLHASGIRLRNAQGWAATPDAPAR